MILNTQIKKYRMDANLTQEDLAKKMYLSRQSISKWENGESLPSVENLVLLSEILQIPLDELIKGRQEFPLPFAFGKLESKWPLVLHLTLPAISLLGALLSPFGSGEFYAYFLVAIFLFLIGITISFFDFKRYYQYFVLTHAGIDVDMTPGKTKIARIVSGLMGHRKGKLIPYSQIESLEIYFDNEGYSPENPTVLRYRPRQMYLVRERFMWILTTKQGEKFQLPLDMLFYSESQERKYFPSIMTFLREKDVCLIDQYGIIEAMEKEFDLIKTAYQSKKVA